MDEVATALREIDTDDRRQIYLAWCRLGAHRREIVPSVARAFAITSHARGRESHLYYVMPYARFDDATLELGIRALADARKEVRYRACGLLAHSRRSDAAKELRKIKSGPTREAARRAERALLEGKRFGPDDDPVYFFYGHEPYRAPRGSFADALCDGIGDWLLARGFAPAQLFQHVFEYRDAERVVRACWDAYDVEARVSITAATALQSTASTQTIRGGPGDIEAIGETVRRLVGR